MGHRIFTGRKHHHLEATPRAVQEGWQMLNWKRGHMETDANTGTANTFIKYLF